MTAIITCIDDSTAAKGVTDYAIWASQQLQQPLQFLHVLDKRRYPQAPTASAANALEELDTERVKLGWNRGEELLAKAQSRAKSAGVKSTGTQRHGRLPTCVEMVATGAPLVVIGKRGSDSKAGQFIGSQLENVIRTIQNPVLVAAHDFSTPKKVLVAYDNSPTAQKIISFIASSQLLKGCEIHLLMVGLSSGDNATALNQAAETLRQAGYTVHANLQQGDVEALLLAYKKKHHIDLLVMGAYGHSRIRNFIVGSNTVHMMQQTEVPLLLLR